MSAEPIVSQTKMPSDDLPRRMMTLGSRHSGTGSRTCTCTCTGTGTGTGTGAYSGSNNPGGTRTAASDATELLAEHAADYAAPL